MTGRSIHIFALMGLFASAPLTARAADDKTWLNASYDVRLHVAIDSSAEPGLVTEKLVERLERLVHRNLYPHWRCAITSHSGHLRTALLQQLRRLEQVEADFETGTDKTIYLTITATPSGIDLACRERDTLTEQWSPVMVRRTRQELLLVQSSFELLCETFSPHALVQIDPQQDDHTQLALRGSALLPAANTGLFVKTRSVFQPFLVRTSRSGASVGKVMPVPWTYLVAEERQDLSWQAMVYSGSRRPFGVRRRAGIDIVGLELKPVAGSTLVRFHAGHDPEQALAGYEVFEKAANADEFLPTGFTGVNGGIVVERREFPVMLVALRTGTQPLVQVPVVPGANAELKISVSDDIARLRVQESLTTFREQMVDIVARRNILMTRARDQLTKGKQQEAKKLLEKIGDLPTRANMDRFLATLERDPASHSENPRVQAKIDRLFADSRKMMSTYLTTRELLELETKVNNSN
jgi:hypothetical protein